MRIPPLRSGSQRRESWRREQPSRFRTSLQVATTLAFVIPTGAEGAAVLFRNTQVQKAGVADGPKINRLRFDRVGRMRVSVLLVLVFTGIHSGLSQEQATAESCREHTQLFYDGAPISRLPAQERTGIIAVVGPDLTASQAGMGFDTHDLTPGRLSSLLRYKELATEAGAERVVAVTYQDPTGCGNHGQCPGYLLAIGPHGVRSLVAKDGPLGMSVGGTWGAAVIPRKESAYPDLLFLATISGSEVAVGCYRWGGHAYNSGCDVPCAQVLAHPDQP